MSEIRAPEEVQTLLAEVVRVQSWGDMAAYNELLDHDAAQRARIAELEAARDLNLQAARSAQQERDAALQRAEAAEASVAVLTEHLRGIADEFALRADWTVDSRHWAQDEDLARGIREAIEDPPTAAVALQAKAGLADRMAERLAEEVAGALDGLVGGAVGRLGTFLVGGQCNYCGRGESTAHYGPEGIIHNETCVVKKGQEALAAYRAATAPADGGGQG